MKVEIDVEEVKRVFRLLEDLHDLVHQPLNYRDTNQVEIFADRHYLEVKDLYYKVVWNWLPEEVQRQITET